MVFLVQLLLEAEDLPLELADLGLGLAGLVQIPLDLTAQLLGSGLGLEQFVGDVGGGEDGGVGTAPLRTSSIFSLT